MTRSVDDIRAGVCMSLAEMCFIDLVAWDSGDEGRFDRMVVSGGASSGASPELWSRRIAAISGEIYVAERHGARLVEMLEWLEEKGLYSYNESGN